MSTKEADQTGYAVVDLSVRVYLDPETKGWTPDRLAMAAETATHNAVVEKIKVPCAVRVCEFKASYPSPKAIKARKAREAEEAAEAPAGGGAT